MERLEMARNGRNGWKWLEIARNGWKWLEMAGMAGNTWKWREMAGNGKK